MGPGFHRWLARPSTPRLLRQLIAPDEQVYNRPACAGETVCNAARRRWHGTATVAAPAELKVVHAQHTPTSFSVQVDEKHRAAELLGSTVHEYGVGMSMHSGVLLFNPAFGQESSFEQLRFQADVASDEQLGKLLVDQPEHNGNLALWVELLRFRQRLDGLAGIIEVWQGMRKRTVDLPASGDEADILWTEFLDAANARGDRLRTKTAQSLRHDIVAYAKDVKARTGQRYPQVYNGIVGQRFGVDSGTTIFWHNEIVGSDLVDPTQALKMIIPNVLSYASPEQAYKTFRRLYRDSTERDCYDVAIPVVVERRGHQHALKWHRLFLKHGDGPSSLAFARDDVQRLFDLDKDMALPMIHAQRLNSEAAADAGASAPPNSTNTTKEHSYPSYTRSSMSTLLGDVHGIKPRELSDSFVAKMFATRAFSLDLIVRGLHFFAVDRLGPLAVREMAIRAASPVELSNRLNELKAMEIAVSNSIYCRLLTKLAAEGHAELYTALLASDQHPEAYEDTATQEALLVSFLEAEDWSQAHVTMIALSLGGTLSESRAVNRLAQHYLRSSSWRLAAQTIESMQTQKLQPTITTIICLHKHMLAERRRGKRPVESQRRNRPRFNSLDFVTNAYMHAARTGLKMYPHIWVELLKRYGMTLRWAEFERLVLWLVSHYGRVRKRRIRVSGQRRYLITGGSWHLNIILSDQMLQAIFTWGFRAGTYMPNRRSVASEAGNNIQRLTSANVASSGTASHMPWQQGLSLLRRLKRSGVAIPTSIVCRAFYNRMWIHFGPGTSSRAINERSRHVNQLRLSEYIQQANRLWDDRLITLPHPKLLADDTPDEALLKLAFFGRYRRALRKEETTDWVDVGMWTSALLNGHEEYRPPKIRQRQRVWQRSPFRRSLPRLPTRPRPTSSPQLPPQPS